MFVCVPVLPVFVLQKYVLVSDGVYRSKGCFHVLKDITELIGRHKSSKITDLHTRSNDAACRKHALNYFFRNVIFGEK